MKNIKSNDWTAAAVVDYHPTSECDYLIIELFVNFALAYFNGSSSLCQFIASRHC